MEIKGKNYLLQKLQLFRSKRHQHEQIIDRLVNDSTQRPLSRESKAEIPICDQRIGTLQKYSNFGEEVSSHANGGESARENNDGQAELTQRSNMSNVSSMSHQVNLDIYLSKKPNLNHKPALKSQPNNLSLSLHKKYGDKSIKIAPNHGLRNSSTIVSQKPIDFAVVAQYIHDNNLWEEIFMEKEQHYYAYICPQFNTNGNSNSNGQIVDLSGEGLRDWELGLVMDGSVHYTEESVSEESNSSGSQEEGGSVCIGYLLLHRLLGVLGTGYAPHVLQTVLGFPYRVYNITQTKSYLQLKQSLPLANPNSTLLLAKQLLNQKLQPLHPSQLSPQHLDNLIDQYSQLIVIKTVKNMCSKEVHIVQRRNHHSVVDFENTGERELEVICTFLGQGSGGFRYCLLGDDGGILQFSQPTQQERQSFTLKLGAEREYKLYISHTPTPTTPPVLSFTLLLQSHHSLSPLHPCIKFNQCYNIMTQTIINRYLSDYADIDEIERQMIRMSHTEGEHDLLVVRARLRVMGLGVDFVALQDRGKLGSLRNISQKDKHRERVKGFQIGYQDREVLCDRHYQDNTRKITISSPQIYQIHLSKYSDIKSTSNLTLSFSQLTL